MTTSVNQIRKTFLDYFEKNGHKIVPASSLVPDNDPTLMFTNSGMVQFKNILAGNETRDYTRAATSQKSVRAGGKHNDLDSVGYDVRHHTFFEMLGNFSFGDYFKEEAIYYAWELLTKEFMIPKEKLAVAIFHTDDEAYNIWKKVSGLSDERIIRIATKDNFWQMGDTGPCGPCSEIFYDHGPEVWGGLPGTPEEDGDRFIEIWNLVFDQYEDLPDGSRINLKKPSIDTGMGLERIAAILQGVHSNFDTDTFQHIIKAIADIANTDPKGPLQASHNVVADHLRAMSFLIADGVLPSNEGRGYVLRRIMRRAMRHAYLLGVKEPMMYKLLPVLQKEMGDAYPELYRFEKLILRAIGAPSPEKIFDTKWFALKNFHGHWYSDADRLEELFAFRENMPVEDYFKRLASKAPSYLKLACLCPAFIMKLFMGRVAMNKTLGTRYWIKSGNAARIDAFFGGMDAYDAIEPWGRFRLHSPDTDPGAEELASLRLYHGYDETIPSGRLDASVLQEAAAFRGGKLISAPDVKGEELLDSHEVEWECHDGHRFRLTPRTVLLGGYWCPQCMEVPDDYPRQALYNKFLAQVVAPLHGSNGKSM